MSVVKQEFLEKKRLAKIISTWAGKNKKVFWKYEVSCYYQTYKISIINLPDPSEKDITVLPNNRVINNQQRTQLCNVIKTACTKAGMLSESRIDVKVNYVNGSAVIAEVIQPG